MAILPATRVGLVGPTGPTGPTGPGPTWTVVETDVSAGSGKPRRAGRFTVAGTGLTAGKPVHVMLAALPWTGKGSLPDESSMDQITAFGIVTNTTTITVYWQSPTFVRGNVKFAYIVSV